MWKEFKEFAFKGNVVDMAVGVMIATAFGKIVSSLVSDIFMPLIGLLTGGVNFDNMFAVLNGDGTVFATAAEAQEAGFSTLNYGTFIGVIVDFFLVAICIFLMVKFINKMQKKKEEAPAEPPKPARICPFCKSEIADGATRCPHCTSELPAEE